jgi:hypothetical protein
MDTVDINVNQRIARRMQTQFDLHILSEEAREKKAGLVAHHVHVLSIRVERAAPPFPEKPTDCPWRRRIRSALGWDIDPQVPHDSLSALQKSRRLKTLPNEDANVITVPFARLGAPISVGHGERRKEQKGDAANGQDIRETTRWLRPGWRFKVRPESINRKKAQRKDTGHGVEQVARVISCQVIEGERES